MKRVKALLSAIKCVLGVQLLLCHQDLDVPKHDDLEIFFNVFPTTLYSDMRKKDSGL